jgi:hypothetical protein
MNNRFQQDSTMKKLLISLLSLLPLLLLPLDSSADKDKGPSDRAFERANDNASFKHDNDHKEKNKNKHHDDDDDDDGDHKDNKKTKKKDKQDGKKDSSE